jgi:hypothetical protein
MTDKPLKSLNGKKFTGPLAMPIDIDHLYMMPELRGDWPAFVEHLHRERRRQYMAKIPHLAKQLDIQFTHLDLQNRDDLLSFYGCIVENLATRLIPGFQEKKPRKNRALEKTLHPLQLDGFLTYIKLGQETGRFKTVFDGCKEVLTTFNPNLAKNANRAKLRESARTLENQLGGLKLVRKRSPVHKKPRLRIVK